MSLMFGYMSNLAPKLFLTPMLSLTFVMCLKYAHIVNEVKK